MSGGVPEILQKKKCCVRVQVDNDYSFVYSILCSLNYGNINEHPERATHYTNLLNSVNMRNINIPFKLKDINKFENQNGHLQLTILKWHKNEARVLHSPTRSQNKQTATIMLIQESTYYFFVAITSISRLINRHFEFGDFRKFRKYCSNCLKGFCSDEKLIFHQQFCYSNVIQNIVMPSNTSIMFDQWSKTVSPDFVIYGDIECMLPRGDRDTILQKHIPIACGYLIVSINKVLDYKSFKEKKCIKEMLQQLERDAINCVRWSNTNPRKPMLTTEYDTSEICYLCKQIIQNGDQVRDHCHKTGNYLVLAHSKCNLSRFERRSCIPFIFHNLNYDLHHILKESGMKHWTFRVIAKSRENYKTLSAYFNDNNDIIHLRFIDSLQFLPASLAKLVEQCSNFVHTSNLEVNDRVKYGKGIFPYSYITSESVLEEDQLPSISAFYDVLEKDVKISKEQ